MVNLILRIAAFIIVFFAAIGVLMAIRRMQIPSRVRKAEEMLKAGDHLKASEIIKVVLEKKKEYAPARYVRAQILTIQKQYLLAISELNGILSLPDFKKYVQEVDIHYRLADLYGETQQHQKEIEEYRAILNFNPDDVKANHRVGHALFRQKKYREVRDHLFKAYTMDPSLIDCLLPLGVSSYHLSEFDAAENYLLRSIEANPNQFEAHYYLGVIYKGKKDHETAVRMFENAKRDSRYFTRSLLRMGEMFFENDQFAKAIEVLEQGIGKVKGDDEEGLAYRYLLAECYESENRISEAVYHWEQIAKKNADFRSTRLKLEDYNRILHDENVKILFDSSLTELQPLLVEIIAGLNHNIISRTEVSHNEYYFKAFNIKRSNEPPLLVYFNRTTREITESQILDFHKKMIAEKCKSGIYITTSKFGIKARSAGSARAIDLLDSAYLSKAVEKIRSKVQKK